MALEAGEGRNPAARGCRHRKQILPLSVTKAPQHMITAPCSHKSLRLRSDCTCQNNADKTQPNRAKKSMPSFQVACFSMLMSRHMTWSPISHESCTCSFPHNAARYRTCHLHLTAKGTSTPVSVLSSAQKHPLEFAHKNVTLSRFRTCKSLNIIYSHSL